MKVLAAWAPNRPCHLIFAPLLRSGRRHITLGGATIPPISANILGIVEGIAHIFAIVIVSSATVAATVATKASTAYSPTVRSSMSVHQHEMKQ